MGLVPFILSFLFLVFGNRMSHLSLRKLRKKKHGFLCRNPGKRALPGPNSETVVTCFHFVRQCLLAGCGEHLHMSNASVELLESS